MITPRPDDSTQSWPRHTDSGVYCPTNITLDFKSVTYQFLPKNATFYLDLQTLYVFFYSQPYLAFDLHGFSFLWYHFFLSSDVLLNPNPNCNSTVQTLWIGLGLSHTLTVTVTITLTLVLAWVWLNPDPNCKHACNLNSLCI